MFQINDDALDMLFREAYSHVSFTDDDVPADILTAAYDVAKFGPTAHNSQPMRIFDVRSKDARDRLIPLMAGSNKERIAQAPLVLILAYDTQFHDNFPIVNPGVKNPDTMFLDDAQREKYAHENALLQAAWLIIALRAAGLSVNPMTGFKAGAINKQLLGDKDKAFMILATGFPQETAPPQDRKPRIEAEQAITEL